MANLLEYKGKGHACPFGQPDSFCAADVGALITGKSANFSSPLNLLLNFRSF
jgi:hypothetical protein